MSTMSNQSHVQWVCFSTTGPDIGDKIRRCSMDFIERIFGFSPDGGSGLFELVLFLIPLAGIAAVYLFRHWQREKDRRA
jgi:hypothetical protein